MKRIAAILGITLAFGGGYVVLGNARSAEGPAQGGGSVVAAKAPGGGGGPKGPQAVPVLAATVTPRDMRQVLEVTGTLRTDDDVQIGSRIDGKVVRVTVREGDRVQAGQVLVQLDDRELRAQMARAEGNLASARARLSLAKNQSTWKDTAAQSENQRALAGLSAAKSRLQQAETNLKLIDVETQKRVETAQSGVRVATERLSIARDLTRKQELRQAQLEVEQAMAQMEQAKVDADNARQVHKRREDLFRESAIAREEVDEAERRWKAAEASARVAVSAVEVARQKVDLAREGSRGEEIRIAEGQLRAAERALELAESDLRRKAIAEDEVAAAKATLRQAEAAVETAKAGLVQGKMSLDEIRNAQAAVQSAQADIQFYRTQLEDLTITAPVSGVVSTRTVNVGEMISKSTTLIHLVALDTVFFEAQVPELEIGLLRPGMSAEVIVDSISGTRFPGRIREVIPVADRASRQFRVRVAVMGGRGRLPANGYARATVQVGTRPNTVSVAKDAVQTESGDKFVWLVSQGEGGLVAKRQLVTVGLVDDRHAEILSGLKTGDQVVAAGSPAIIDGTVISVSER